MTILQIALDVPLPRLFDYRLAGESQGNLVGRLVRVPFGRGVRFGVVVGEATTSDQPAEKLKAAELIDDLPALPADWLELCGFCARYYHYPLGQVVTFALPPLLRRGKKPRMLKDKAGAVPPAPTLPVAMPDQVIAIDAITAASGFQTFLLHGVTGSGKTEVYLRAIAAVLERGGQALMLVPEIALTPQLESRVSARFPSAHIVAAHSGVGDAARTRAFLAALEGRAAIVLGTRLSVFMPLPALQLIVVDEEHDASFKQQEGLRYSARDVAIFRAKQRAIPIVLGSATPSLETFHHASCGRYRKLDLPLRAVAAAMPTVATVDTRKEKLQDGLSAALLAAVGARLEKGEQSLLFLNRRGYAPVLACPACGWISHCRRCAANMVLHLADRRLRCHHCGLEVAIPHTCPDCGNLDLQPFGRGTQRLEVALTERFPTARILRIDRDSADSPKKWHALLAAIHAGEADMLVGTQMLAKGHDFPKLTLVGVVGADAALFAADFRAPERLFAQLMQVGGRSGRAHLPGAVLIQTEYPDHPLYRALINHDYSAFANEQLAERAVAGFPPFTFQALLRAEAPALPQALEFLATAVTSAEALGAPDIMLYDPVPMRMARLKNRERAQLLVESKSRPALQSFLADWMPRLYALKTPRELRWHLDVDPQEF
ncbi:MAG: primosomal protein N' [Gammaproteobacteria bacterium]|nr:primosomal protein N' [Rhodocyclaceae bacterium]MBU3909250.1 primosomal protein N' [Gammaproteobacteria bacterium]MBU3989642.1 primosomal protein N' [Gammaproteobacteria bacterium]MBU4005590.1 primosomal protein N' [Gammaproteobacteria bacterium]MBU4020857.1 primosomal protein N' [Gammaproteobacteria bacterium]